MPVARTSLLTSTKLSSRHTTGAEAFDSRDRLVQIYLNTTDIVAGQTAIVRIEFSTDGGLTWPHYVQAGFIDTLSPRGTERSVTGTAPNSATHWRCICDISKPTRLSLDKETR